jgi:hypothetical protein
MYSKSLYFKAFCRASKLSDQYNVPVQNDLELPDDIERHVSL